MKGRTGSLAGRVLWAAILAGGFGVLWLLIALVGGGLFVFQWRNWHGGPLRRAPNAQELIITTDGRPLLHSRFGNGESPRYRRVDGTPEQDSVNVKQADWIPVWHMREASHIGEPYFVLGVQGRKDWDWRVRAFFDETHPELAWFFMHDGREEGAGYFVGYNRAEKQCIGYIGQSGFRPTQPPREQWFPVKRSLIKSPLFKLWTSVDESIQPRGSQFEKSVIPGHLVFVPCGKELKQVDLSTRDVRTVLTATEPIDGFRIASRLSPLDEPAVRRQKQQKKSAEADRDALAAPETALPGAALDDAALVVLTAHKLYALNRQYAVLTDFAIPDEARGLIEWFHRQGWAIAFLRSSIDPDGNVLSHEMLYAVAPDGTIRRRQEIEYFWQQTVPWHQRIESALVPLALPAPLVLAFLEPLLIAQIDLVPEYRDGFSVMAREGQIYPCLVALLSLALAAFSWRRGVAFSLPLGERITWVAFVLLFGLAGYVGFLLHRRWPLREDCPRCHARTVLSSGACVDCGERFPGPVFKGTEVFA
jgi:hypothetical protein